MVENDTGIGEKLCVMFLTKQYQVYDILGWPRGERPFTLRVEFFLRTCNDVKLHALSYDESEVG